MAGIYVVTVKVVQAGENIAEVKIELVFASQKVAKDVRDQLKNQGYKDTLAQLTKELD